MSLKRCIGKNSYTVLIANNIFVVVLDNNMNDI